MLNSNPKILYFSIFFITLVISIYFLISPEFHIFVNGLNSLGYLGALIAGFFFSSFLTASASTVSLFLLGKQMNPFILAPIAAFGAMLADFLIFSLIKYRVSHHYGILDKLKLKLMEMRFIVKLKDHRSARYFVPMLAAFIIASPLPDELGIALLGASKYDTKKFFLFAFLMNMVGILGIAYFGSIV